MQIDSLWKRKAGQAGISFYPDALINRHVVTRKDRLPSTKITPDFIQSVGDALINSPHFVFFYWCCSCTQRSYAV